MSDKPKDLNPDPITGEPGAHPVGTGLGALAGGAAAGAAVGTVAGPIGTAVGAAVGAVVGGLAGKAVAEGFDPTVEHAYWKEEHARQPYYVDGYTYEEDYRPAYDLGLRDVDKHRGRSYDEVQETLAEDWDAYRGKSRLTWAEASPAARAAWERAQHLNMSQ
ncbi:hypothetical protein FVQ98_07585 [Ottowia sp. GY511]|uniref:Glycine zipper domain-containing protein n=1 Tax=Ottowia flava TaxID=2675430 RepID=A0ABW4KMZ0_9BURK|nr:hypothetical protein [Ottowia sp. GY511]TXK29742.1 hypothetical protein FVQ98_07585 [Ottowia sp. GY511]